MTPEPNALLNRKIQSLGPQGFKCAIISAGRTACGQKGVGVFLKGEWVCLLSFLALINCTIIIKMIKHLSLSVVGEDNLPQFN